MKTIPDIIELAISSTDQLPTAMLHCKVLSSQLGHGPFDKWVTQEVSGYDSLGETPAYRRIPGRLKGTFERYFVFAADDDVPVQALGGDLRRIVETLTLPQPIGVLASFPDDGSVSFPPIMERELLQIINPNFSPHGRFHNLKVVCRPGGFNLVLVRVQQQLVSFLAEMNKLFPTSESVNVKSLERPEELDHIFDKAIKIDNVRTVVIAPSYTYVDQSSIVFQQVQIGDWASLDSFLAEQNVSADMRVSVKQILEKVPLENDTEEAQHQLKEWIDDASESMARGVGEVLKEATKDAASKTLTDGLLRYAPDLARWGWVVAMSLA